MTSQQSQIKHPFIVEHHFLFDLSEDDYFATELVEQGQKILIELCLKIEAKPPQTLDALYALTHATTTEFNALAIAFARQDCEFDSMAQDNICQDILFIAQVYGFADAETEQLVINRTW